SETSLSFIRFRMTPARNPRTECFCQPVSLVIAAIVAPAGDRNIASTPPCFVLRAPWLIFAASADCCCFVASGSDFVIDRFCVDFDIEILHSVYGDVTPHHRSPTTAMKPAGQDSWVTLWVPGVGDSTALIVSECQSILRAFPPG